MKKLSLIFLLFLLAHLSSAQFQNNDTEARYPDKEEGYMGMVEIGYLYGKIPESGMNRSMATPSIQVFNGYRFNRYLAVGGTIGFDFYDNVVVTPFALGIRGELLNTRVSPIYSFDAGYGSTILTDTNSQFDANGGWMYNPALGIRAKAGNQSAFTFSVGYKSQRVETMSYLWNWRTVQKINYKRLTLRVGFSF